MQATQRRGVSAIALLLAFTTILCLLGLAVDVGLLVQRHQQLKTAGEAAALAAAQELFTSRFEDENTDRFGLARQTALRFAAANQRFDPAAIAGSEARPRGNDAGDVVFGWMDPPELGSFFTPRSPDESSTRSATPAGSALARGDAVAFGSELNTRDELPVNAVLVRTRHDPRSRDGVLAIGRLLGVPAKLFTTESIAAVDRRIVGFRPVGCTSVPLMPLVVESRTWPAADRVADQHSADETDDGRKEVPSWRDQFTVDPRTGQIAEGPDGIPEIEIVLGHRGDDPTAADAAEPESNDRHRRQEPLPASFFATSDVEQLAHCVCHGLDAEDLAIVNGEVRIGTRIALATSVLELGDLQAVHSAIAEIAGQPRVFAHGQRSDGESGGSALLTNFSAGVVIRSQFAGSSLTICVQPAVVNSCTAIVQGGAETNPWIGKVLLVR